MKVLFIYIFLFVTSLLAQKNYFVTKDGLGDFSSLKEINNFDFNIGDIVSFKSGEQFDDATLLCQKGVIYNTFGGSEKAIIGKSTISGYPGTIYIAKEDVTISNLIIYAYKNSKYCVRYTKGGLTIKNCDILGNPSSHSNSAFGIELYNDYPLSKKTLITGNVVRDFYKGMYFRVPYNLEVSYNKVYKMYKYSGYYGNGGDCIVGTKSTATPTHDAEYTFHIHHNELSEYEHTTFWVGNISGVLIEYNDIHTNLDERLYFGGVKSGSLGKLWDNTGQPVGSLGNILRYNYIHDIKKYGEPGYKYSRPTPAQIEAGAIQVISSNTGEDFPIYANAMTSSPTSDDFKGTMGGTFSGQGYGNYWIHNNIIYNSKVKILSKGRNYIEDNLSNPIANFNRNYRSYFVNNTLIQTGQQYWITSGSGVLLSESTSQSPDFIVNNIIDFLNPNAAMAGRWKEDELYLDYNIYTLQEGSTTTLPNKGERKAAYYQRGVNQNKASGLNEQYLTNPNWVDTTTMFFASNIGPNGVWIPDVRIKENGNAHNKGMDYDLIGDTYTVLGRKHELGKDPTGRSFAYDILGNYRATNDIGAVGIGSSINPQPTYNKPIITKQPENYSANTGENIKFTVNATPQDEIGFQWWKSPYINDSESKINNSAKYSGANTNTLNINNVNSEDANVKYVCEVYNKNDPQNLWVNSEPASIILRQDLDPLKSNGLKVFMEAVYDNGQMENNLSNLLPNSQPYNTLPWNLELNETIDKVKADYIDWVIIELRKSEKQITYRKPGIITDNGFIVNSDGTKLSFKDVLSDKYYIAIKHRNHLGIMSSLKVDVKNNEPILYDFTASQNSAYGVNPMAELGDGNFGLYSGDADANGVINNLDFGKVANNIPFKGYSNSDLDMNGSVNVLDYNKINKNILKISRIPK